MSAHKKDQLGNPVDMSGTSAWCNYLSASIVFVILLNTTISLIGNMTLFNREFMRTDWSNNV